MNYHTHGRREAGHQLQNPDHHPRHTGFVRRWVLANSLVAGFFALCWLRFRSGTKPSRFAYPCQQAALSTATLAFGAPLVSALITARRRLVSVVRTPTGATIAAMGLLMTAGAWSYFSRTATYQGPVLDPRQVERQDVVKGAGIGGGRIGERLARGALPIGLGGRVIALGLERVYCARRALLAN